MQETIILICQDFFEKLSVDFTDLQVQTESENIYNISLKSSDSNLLIGPHGKNLEVITHLLKVLITKRLEGFITIHFEVNDYLKQKDQKLLHFISSKVKIVQQSGKEVILPFFTAYERKKVHSYVSENGGNIFTQSVGEGKERRIHLYKKDEKMTIDIDGEDI